jgi:hypothetical protein
MDSDKNPRRLLLMYALELFLPREVAEDVDIALEEKIERLRSGGRSMPAAYLLCFGEATSMLVAYQWLRFTSRPERVIAGSNAQMGIGRFELYRGQGAFGALMGIAVTWIVAKMALNTHGIDMFGSAAGIKFACGCVGTTVALMVCRTAYKRGEFLPLAVVYIAAVGALTGAIVGTLPIAAAILFEMPSLPMMLQRPFFFLCIGLGMALNLYAKYRGSEPST